MEVNGAKKMVNLDGLLLSEKVDLPENSPCPTPYQTRSSSPIHERDQEFDTKDVLSKPLLPTVEPHGILDERYQANRRQVQLGKYLHLALYFLISLALTIYNKVVLGSFPYPYLLTALHTAAGSIGCQFLLHQGIFTLTPLVSWNHVVLALFSLLYTLNIAISNVSLNLVTIPFHQVIRAIAPLFTILISTLLFSATYSHATYLALVPIMAGVALATYGDYYFTLPGLLLTLLGALLAALKTVLTHRLQTGLSTRLPALEILHRMSPLACLQSLVYSYLSGELSSLLAAPAPSVGIGKYASILLANAAMAFALNYVSFTANRKTGPLTMTVAANLKQVLTVVLSVVFWRLKVGWLNGVGIGLTLVGGWVYARVEGEVRSS